MCGHCFESGGDRRSQGNEPKAGMAMWDRDSSPEDMGALGVGDAAGGGCCRGYERNKKLMKDGQREEGGDQCVGR